MKIYMLTLLFSAFSLLATAQTFTQKNVDDINQGLLKDPIGFLKANAAPDYTLTTNGKVSDLATVLARFEALKLVSWVVSDVKIRQYGTTAITTGTVKHSYTVKANGASVSFADLFTYISAYQGGKWLIVGGQHSDIPLDFTEKTLQDMSTRIVADFRKYMQEEASPDIRITLAEGQVTDHKSMIGLLPALQITKWSLSDVKISHFGNMAVATGINIHDVLNVKANTTAHFTVRFTYTYAYINGKWMWMQWQHTHIVPSDQKTGPTIQKGNLVGIRNMTVELKPNVTMEQVIDFYNTRWIPDADKYFGFKGFVGKCLRGTDCAENKLRLIFHFKTEAERDKYFKMAEGGRDLNELGAKAWAQFVPTDDALQQLATVKFDWADWLIK